MNAYEKIVSGIGSIFASDDRFDNQLVGGQPLQDRLQIKRRHDFFAMWNNSNMF